MSAAKGFRVDYFASVAEALERSQHPSATNRAQWKETQRLSPVVGRGASREFWYGIDGGPSDVLRAVAEGWPEGVARLAGLADGISVPPARNVHRRQAWADEGGSFSWHRAWDGCDDAFRRRTRIVGNGPERIRIVIPLAATAQVPSETFFARGAAGLVLANVLEEAGHSVEIVGIMASTDVYRHSHKAPHHAMVVTLKESDRPIDMAALATTCCLSGFFRVVGFSLKTTHRDVLSAGYGKSTYGAETLASLLPDFPGRSFQVPAERTFSRHDVPAWIRARVESLEEVPA